MRLVVQEDVEDLKVLFSESTAHANHVGHIDRPHQFDDEYFTQLIEADELFCFEVANRIAGVSRLTEIDKNLAVWEEQGAQYLYAGKLATSNLVRNTKFFETVMLSEIANETKKREKTGIRLDCLADNPRLIDFYTRTGFNNLGVTRIFSSFYEKHVFVTKFELGV